MSAYSMLTKAEEAIVKFEGSPASLITTVWKLNTAIDETDNKEALKHIKKARRSLLRITLQKSVREETIHNILAEIEHAKYELMIE